MPTTRVFGCSTKWADKQASARASLAKWDAEPVALEPIDIDAVAKLVKNDTKKLLVVNLWATWCGPCVAELPELVTMNRMYRTPAVPVRDDQHGRHRQAGRGPAGPQGEPRRGDELHPAARPTATSSPRRSTQKWPGPVPYTIVIAPGGKVLYRKTGQIDPLELKRAIVAHVGRTAS